uniref:Uncharacterized protein n=1 Tax=Ciona intestinalis TaxID=7719 RepID=H2XNA0_CIOIN
MLVSFCDKVRGGDCDVKEASPTTLYDKFNRLGP